MERAERPRDDAPDPFLREDDRRDLRPLPRHEIRRMRAALEHDERQQQLRSRPSTQSFDLTPGAPPVGDPRDNRSATVQ